MRIGFLIDRWPPSLAGRALAAFADHLVAIGHEVLVVTDRVARGSEDVFLHQVRTSRFLTQARRARVLAKALPERARELGCERTVAAGGVLRAHMYWAQHGSMLAAAAAKLHAEASSLGPVDRSALPATVDIESLRGVQAVEAHSQAALLAGGAARIVCPNTFVRDELAALAPAAAERLAIVRPGIELERFRPWYGERDTIRARLGPAFVGELDTLGRRIADCQDASGPYAQLARHVRALEAPPSAGLEAPIQALGAGPGSTTDAHHAPTSKLPTPIPEISSADLAALLADRGAPIIAFVAREPKLKGLPALTRALARLVDRPWRLVVAGAQHFSDVERFLVPFGPAMSEPSPNGTRFARRWAFMPQVNVGLLLRAANVTALPVWRDTRGIATLASLATGRRVITTLQNGNADLVLNGAYPPREQRITRSDHGSLLFDASLEGLLADAIAAELDNDCADAIETTYQVSKATHNFDRRRVHTLLERELEAAED